VSRDPRYGFEDVSDDVDAQQGIFADGTASLSKLSAMSQQSAIRPALRPEGLIYNLSCPRCGVFRPMVLEWPELVAVRHSISPHFAYQGQQVLQQPTPWVYDAREHGFYPDGAQDQQGMPCNCGGRIKLVITIQEIDRRIQDAVGAGVLAPADVQRYSAIAQAMKQRMGMR